MASKPLRKNRRRNMRRAVALTCQVVREEDFRLIGDETLDVSPDGMLVHTEREDVEPGQSLIVTFQATDLGLWFDTQATVARVLRGRRWGERGRAVGVRFAETGEDGAPILDPVRRMILRGAFRRKPPPIPRNR
jgi:uncharacterized protein YndB with AHSA1/START domain